MPGGAMFNLPLRCDRPRGISKRVNGFCTLVVESESQLVTLLTLLILEIVLATLEAFAEVRCLENSLPSSFCQVSKSSWTVGQRPTHSPTCDGGLVALLKTITLVALAFLKLLL